MLEKSYERLGYFYLGRVLDLRTRKASGEAFLYDSRDLTTHAVILGMTGSGKTGLGIALLEEAALDGVPALILDPKGDLSNLMLAFPELAPEQFFPFVREEEAARKNLPREKLAEEVAARWREGLLAWDQDGERVRRYRESARPLLVTPGSRIAHPLAVLGSLAAPSAAERSDSEALRDRIEGTVSSLLSLVGVDGDPLQSREHILLAQILYWAWQQGQDLDLVQLLKLLERPPISRVGALELESFFPARDRFALAMRLNHLLAAPGFEVWLEGLPLDVDSLLWDEAGRPRLAILSLAHLSERERMFVVSLVASSAVAWMRKQAGTSALRALLYFDEVFGYLSPTSQPPSKKPLLTLLKQARASGLGLVLATQNPVDLDYKGLANVGTWMLGRLQTERDKLRLLDGLESLALQDAPERSELDRLLSSLEKRQFLVQNVHQPGPVLIESRWALSYLAGPLDRRELERLVSKGLPWTTSFPPRRDASPIAAAPRETSLHAPLVPPGIAQRFLVDGAAPRPLSYLPALLAKVQLDFENSRLAVRHRKEEWWLVPFGTDQELELTQAWRLAPGELAFAEKAEEGATFAPVPPPALRPESYGRWQQLLAKEAYRSAELVLWEVPSLKQVSRPGENEREFRIRLGSEVREARDRALEELRKRWELRLKRVEARVARAEARVVREREEAVARKLDTALAAGSTLLTVLFGRRKLSATSVARTVSTFRSASRSQLAAREVEQAEAELAQAREELKGLHEALEAELAETAQRFDLEQIPILQVNLRPKRQDVTVDSLFLAWVPAGGRLVGRLGAESSG